MIKVAFHAKNLDYIYGYKGITTIAVFLFKNTFLT